MADTKKKSLLGTIMGAFVEEVPDAPKKGRSSQPPAPPQATSPSFTMTGAVSHTTAPVVPDQAVLAKLEAKLQASVPPVYSSFMEQFELLHDTIPDEGMRFKAALKTSRTSVQELSGAVDQMLKVLSSAHEEFDHSFEENRKRVVEQSQQSIKATDEVIQTRENQIKSIQEEITSLKSKRQADEEHLHGEEQRFDGIRAGFEAAHNQVVTKLTAQRNRIAAQG